MLTNEEVLCTFMEPDSIVLMDSELCWHRRTTVNLGCDYCAHDLDGPIALTLDALHEVEARLTDEQWGEYGLTLAESLQSRERHFARNLIHASANQKIAALAAVLRPVVEQSC